MPCFKDIYVRVDLHDEIRNRDGIIPEHFLWVAVIKQAISDLDSTDPIVARSAKRWICEDRKPDINYPNSFINICESLGLRPDEVRDRILYGDSIGG